jgi:RHS repeat-associated protein
MVLPFGLLRGKMSIMESESVMGLYVYDGADIVAEKDGSGNYIAFYVHGPGMDEPLARIAADGSVRYYHADGLGSIIALTDATGAVTTRYRYSPFGKTETIGEDVAQPFRYTGREWDDVTGLYFYRARYYSPEIGRFITEDPIGLGAGDVNFYAYVGNDPVNRTDPSGLLSADYHFAITKQAAMALGYPPSVAAAMAQAVVKMDSGTQGMGANDTNIHAMGGLLLSGLPQKKEEAISATLNLITDALNDCDIDTALHAAQDFETPLHRGVEWRGYVRLSDIRHLYQDEFPADSVIRMALYHTMELLSIYTERCSCL